MLLGNLGLPSLLTPKEKNDNRWLYQPLFYNTRIKLTRNKNKKTRKAFSTPNDMGLSDNIKTRSLKIADFVINDTIIKNPATQIIP